MLPRVTGPGVRWGEAQPCVEVAPSSALPRLQVGAWVRGLSPWRGSCELCAVGWWLSVSESRFPRRNGDGDVGVALRVRPCVMGRCGVKSRR